MIAIPERLARNLVNQGKPAVEWLKQLPSLVAECSMRWSVEAAPAFADVAYSYVAPGVQAGHAPVVLKLMLPGSPEFVDEERFLRWCCGHGAARVLESDASLGAFLLERVIPGESVTRLVRDDRDDDATLAIVRVMSRMWRATDEGAPIPELPSIERDTDALAQLRKTYNGSTGPFPSELFQRAELQVAQLITSNPGTVVLHADLHHDNVLRSERDAWLAIDPKGRLGEPACEAAAMLRNPLPELLRTSDVRKLLKRRVDLIQEVLQLSRERILGWALVMAVVAACWQLEDEGENWEGWIHIAQEIAAFK